jgi:hypothetical protein
LYQVLSGSGGVSAIFNHKDRNRAIYLRSSVFDRLTDISFNMAKKRFKRNLKKWNK